jgi:hypothetical protein
MLMFAILLLAIGGIFAFDLQSLRTSVLSLKVQLVGCVLDTTGAVGNAEKRRTVSTRLDALKKRTSPFSTETHFLFSIAKMVPEKEEGKRCQSIDHVPFYAYS